MFSNWVIHLNAIRSCISIHVNWIAKANDWLTNPFNCSNSAGMDRGVRVAAVRGDPVRVDHPRVRPVVQLPLHRLHGPGEISWLPQSAKEIHQISWLHVPARLLRLPELVRRAGLVPARQDRRRNSLPRSGNITSFGSQSLRNIHLHKFCLSNQISRVLIVTNEIKAMNLST